MINTIRIEFDGKYNTTSTVTGFTDLDIVMCLFRLQEKSATAATGP
jgi:hypothetical protein